MDSKLIDKLIEQQETIKIMQENEDNCLKIMKMYEECKKRINKAIEYIEKLENIKIKYVLFEEEELYASEQDFVKELLEILKGENKE